MSEQQLEKFSYDNTIVKKFLIATIVWGIVGFLVGLIIALQLAFSDWFAEHLPYAQLTFGRLRPLHTNAAIFALCQVGPRQELT